MSTPTPRRRSTDGATATPTEPTVDILPILVSQKVLTAEQAERVRRTIRMNSVAAEQAVIQLGMSNEVQIAQAVAAHAGLPYVKINPLDLDLDVVTKGIAGPFARKHGLVAISKTEETITVAVYDPFAPFPEEDIKRVTGLSVARVVSTRSDVETVNKGFYDLKASLTSAEKQLSRFERRRDNPLKAWKLTEDDWRNRGMREQYVEAVEEMFERTDRPNAPWHPIAAESKRYARVAVLDLVIEQIEAGMRRWGFEPPPSN